MQTNAMNKGKMQSNATKIKFPFTYGFECKFLQKYLNEEIFPFLFEKKKSKQVFTFCPSKENNCTLCLTMEQKKSSKHQYDSILMKITLES